MLNGLAMQTFLKKKENWWKGSENIRTLGIGVNIRKGENGLKM